MSTYRLFVSDMDGTILENHSRITEETMARIRDAEASGIRFAIATGRNYESAKAFLDAAGVVCPIISSNGARVSDETGAVLDEVTLTLEEALRVIEVLHANQAYTDMFYEVYTEVGPVTSRADLIQATLENLREMEGERAELLYKFFHDRYYVNEDVVIAEDIGEFLANQAGRIYKFIVFSSQVEHMKAVWEDVAANVPSVYVTSSGKDNIEVMAKGADKGHGVRVLAAHLGIDLSDVVVIGDHLNDLPMFGVAGKAIAMGNSVPELLRVAHHVTGTSEQQGVAQALERLLSGEWK